MTMRKILLIGLVEAIFCGCMTTVCRSTGGMEIARKEGGDVVVSADDTCFSDWLEVEDTSLHRVDSGCLKAQVSIRNKRKDWEDNDRMDDFVAQYRFVWLDVNGALTGAGESNWLFVRWRGGELKPLEAVSPNSSAASFRLSLRHIR